MTWRPDRVICGIGAWWDPLARNVGIERRKPLDRHARDGRSAAPLAEHGAGDLSMANFIMWMASNWMWFMVRREPRNVPIMIGATGDKMMELTGEIPDGAVLNYCVPPDYNDKALELLEAGAKQCRSYVWRILTVPQLVVCSVDHDHDKAIDTTRELLTQYLAQQPHIAKASGVSQHVVADIQSILGWPATKEQIRKAKHLVPEELILHITASGTPEEARAKVDEYRKHGCTCPDPVPGGRRCQAVDRYLRRDPDPQR